MVTLKSIRKGEFYKLSETSKTVYQKLEYNRCSKKFNVQNQSNGSYLQHSAKKLVFVSFEY